MARCKQQLQAGRHGLGLRRLWSRLGESGGGRGCPRETRCRQPCSIWEAPEHKVAVVMNWFPEMVKQGKKQMRTRKQDHLDEKLVVLFFLTVLGSSIFALGLLFKKGSPYLLPMMLISRLLFGSGNGSLTVIRILLGAKKAALFSGCSRTRNYNKD